LDEDSIIEEVVGGGDEVVGGGDDGTVVAWLDLGRSRRTIGATRVVVISARRLCFFVFRVGHT